VPHHDKRKRILRAAEKLFTTRRFHEVKLDDIVRDAHIGKGTIYRYFESKDDLLFQTALDGLDELQEVLERSIPAEGNFEEQILHAFRIIGRFSEKRRQWYRIMQAEANRMRCRRGQFRRRWRESRGRVATQLVGILQRGVAEGKVRKDVPPEAMAQVLLTMVDVRSRDMGDLPEKARSNEMLIDLFCHGVSPTDGVSTAIDPRKTTAAK
jgi:AcrR family transcriptional regulator